MTVKELIAELHRLPEDLVVVLYDDHNFRPPNAIEVYTHKANNYEQHYAQDCADCIRKVPLMKVVEL